MKPFYRIAVLQKYYRHDPNLTKGSKLQGEHNLALYNCTFVIIIEIKYKARKEDVENLLQKPKTFKLLFPEYTNFDFYSGFVGMSIEK